MVLCVYTRACVCYAASSSSANTEFMFNCTESFNVYSFKENKAIQKMVVLCRDFRQYCLEKKVEVFWRIGFSIVGA